MTLDINTINTGDAIALLKDIPDNYFDSIVMDPPYGIAFMGKGWDTFKKDEDKTGNQKYQHWFFEVSMELLRVLKPGGHLLSFCGCRTYHRMVCAIEDAGFEIRDQIQWLFGSGFPKSKAIDNKDGWGTALKPANEPICLARKPLEKGLTVAQNVLKWGTGAINIDGCRIETDENLNGGAYSGGQRKEGDWKDNSGFQNDKLAEFKQPTGRFPSNVILDEDAAELLDQQTGILKSGDIKSDYICKESENRSMSGKNYEHPMMNRKGDTGGASKFFYCAKTSQYERNKGCNKIEAKKTDHVREHGQAGTDNAFNRGATLKTNHHPTVKPIALMRYLVKLVTPVNGTVLDPFGGSGSTAIACKLEGFNFILLEREQEYVDISNARLKAWHREAIQQEMNL